MYEGANGNFGACRICRNLVKYMSAGIHLRDDQRELIAYSPGSSYLGFPAFGEGICATTIIVLLICRWL